MTNVPRLLRLCLTYHPVLLVLTCYSHSAAASPEAPQPAASETELAQDGQTQAEKRFLVGLDAFKSGEYALAAELFQSAYKLLPMPQFLYNIGQAHRLLGQCEQAVEAYQAYLESEPDGAVSELAREHLTSLQPCTASVSLVPVETRAVPEVAQHEAAKHVVATPAVLPKPLPQTASPSVPNVTASGRLPLSESVPNSAAVPNWLKAVSFGVAAALLGGGV